MAQQHLRNVLAYLDAPALAQPEVFVQVTEGMFDDRGDLARADTKKFLQSWVDRYVKWIELHAQGTG
jgi:chromate reductase